MMMGSTTEAIGGIAAIVLAIIGLANLVPVLVAAIACIAIGVAFLLEGMALGARFFAASEGSEFRVNEAGASISTELLGGITGIVLGVLALLEIAPMTLLPVSLLVYGAVLLLGERVRSARWGSAVAGSERTFLQGSAFNPGPQVLIGVGAIVLGILGVIGVTWTVLTLVGFLVVGTSILLSGSVVSARVASLMP